MKILFITAKYYPEGAGAGRSVRNLAEAVVESGHEAVVLRLSKDGQKREEILDGVKIIYLPLRNIYWLDAKPSNPLVRLLWHAIDSYNILAARDVGKILDTEKPDIVNSNIISGFSVAIYKAVKKRGIKLVHTMRDYYLMCPQSGMFAGGHACEEICAKCKPFAAVRRHEARNVDLFLSNSNYVAQRHKSLGAIGEDKITYVQYNMNQDENIAAPKTLSKNNTIRFGFIGRLDPVKGLEIMLEATKHLKSQNWSLKIAGEGKPDYLASLHALWPDDRIEYLGFTKPDDFYNNIDILICPSVYAEPLPRVVYEAYRAALPVIASDTGGTPEIVDPGKTGFIYNAKDSNALAALMDKLMQDPELYKTLSEGAAAKAEIFKRSAIVGEYLARMETLLGSPRERKAA